MLYIKNHHIFEQIRTAGAILTVMTGLYLSSFYNYLLFHSLIEIVTVTIGLMLFTLTWNTQSYLKNNYLKLISIGYAFIAIIDLTHLLAYKGLNIFTDYKANLPTQLWIAARYLQSLTLCAAPFSLSKRLYNRPLLIVYAVVVTALMAMIFSGNFPDCYLEGTGLTLFKIVSECLITALLLVSLFLLNRKRSFFDVRVYSLIIYSIVLTALSELSFTTYKSVYGFTNMLGHYFKLAAFYFVYRALLVTGIRDPLNLIFRELNETKEKLKNAHNDLEVKIRERTSQLREELTERRLAEEKLKLSENQMRMTMEVAQIGIFDWDVKNDIWYASPEYYTMLGYPPVTGPGDRSQWLERVHPDERETVSQLIRAVLDSEYSGEEFPIYEYEARILHADGNYHWEYVKGFGIRYDEKGHVTRMLGIRMDIQERKIAEEKLARERSLLRCLIDSVNDLIFIKDLKGAYQGCNKASEDFIGMPESEQIGKTDYDFFDKEIAETVQKADREILEKGIPLYIEEDVTASDGRRILMETTKYPYFDSRGETLGIVGISRDITERKRTEQEHMEHLHFLEMIGKINRAIQRTNDVEQMMSNVLDTVLSLFNCDRAWLIYPCDPEAPTWSEQMVRSQSENPDTHMLKLEIPVDSDIKNAYKAVLASEKPVGFGPENEEPLPAIVAGKFNAQSQLAMAVYPKVDKPYMFGIHHCSHSRIWTSNEKNLLKEIGRRLEDALTNFLLYRNLQESEERYRLVFENSPVSIWDEDFSAINEYFDHLKNEGVKDIESYFHQHPDAVEHCASLVKIIDVNRAALILHEAVSKEELKAGLSRVFTPESFKTFRKELICLWNGNTGMISDSRVKTLHGELRDVTVSFAVCPGYEESLGRIIVSIVDITERKETGKALSASETELHSLIQAMTDVIVVGDADGRYLKIPGTNPSLLIRPPEELLGKRLHEVFPEEQADFFLSKITLALNTQEPVNFEYDLPVNGRRIRFNATISPMSREKFVMVARDITLHKKALDDLQKTNDLLQAIIKAAPVAIIGLDLEGKVQSVWNITAEKMLGWSAEEAMGQYLPTVPRDKEEEFRKFRETIKKGLTLDGVEVRREKQNGEPIDYSIYASPLYSPNGSITGNIAVLVDITDRKRKDEAMREMSRRLKEAQRLARIGSWELDLTKNELNWTDEIYNIFEINPETFGGTYEAFLDLIHPDDREAVDSAFTESLKTKIPYVIDHRILLTDGKIKYVHEQCETFYEGDTPLRSLGIVQDITEIKLMFEALQESEWRYREIFDNVLDGLYLLEVTDNGRFRTIEVNPALEKLMGIPRSVSIGKTQEEIVPAKAAEIVNEKYRECVKAGHPMEEEVQLDLPAGKRYFHSTLIPSCDHTGKVHRIIGISRDITDKKKAEEEIALYREHLEELVRERTEELATTNRELEAFSYSVSHDLRAPLRHIDGFMNLLKKSIGNTLDEESRHYMNTISMSAHKMGQLIDDLLSFSQMGRKVLSLQDVDLGIVMHDVIKELRDETSGRCISWQIGDLPVVKGDISLLRIVIMNLLGNAVKFTRSQEETLIEAGCKSLGRETVFFIRDNGVGFDQEYADKLFGVFQRLHKSNEFEGTGVGLALVQRIIHRHGGKVWAKGEVNRGATFYFTLPKLN